MRENFEFDKVVLAIALAIFLFIVCDNLSGLLYRPIYYLQARGYIIENTQETASDVTVSNALPAEIDMKIVMSKANAELGASIFKKCAICHTIQKNDSNKVGPNLWGIVNATAARSNDFAYSSAMSSKKQENLRWTYENLYRYLFAPKKFIEGTKMAFAGIKKDEDRAHLIAYLRTYADSIVPLP